MGDTKLFYSPIALDGGYTLNPANLETITIPQGSTLCDFDLTGDADLLTSGTGRSFATANMRGVTVSISANLGNDLELAEACMALVSFAREGGLVGFALDEDYAFFAQLTTEPNRGDTTFDYVANLLLPWGGLSTPADGWRLYVSSGLPQMRREMVKVESVAGTVVTTVDPFTFTYDPAGLTIVRHKYFFPFLKYVSGDVVLSQPQTGTYRFDCVFKVDVGVEQLAIDSDVVPEVGDPFLMLLLHMEGVDTDTDFIDWGANGMTGEWEAGAVLSATQIKFGLTSAEFDGAGWGVVWDPVGGVHPTEFNIGAGADSILDFWIYPTSNPPTNPRFLVGHERNSSNYWAVQQIAGGTVRYIVRVGGSNTVDLNTLTPLTLNAWNHIVVSRHSNATTLGINGNLEESDVDTTNYDYIESGGAGSFRLGLGGVAGDNFEGFMDELRYRSGVYLDGVAPSSYTIPTAASAPP